MSDERDHKQSWKIVCFFRIKCFPNVHHVGSQLDNIYTCIILSWPFSNYLFNMLRHNRKSQEIRDCIMCSCSSRPFLPFTALSNYVFTFEANIFQLLYRYHLYHVGKIVVFNVLFTHLFAVCLERHVFHWRARN